MVRLLVFLAELIFIAWAFSSVFRLVKGFLTKGKSKKQWDSWVKELNTSNKATKDKNITLESLKYDIDLILKIAFKNVPKESYESLLSIQENISIIQQSNQSLDEIKKNYLDDFLDLVNMLHKYIPESLNKYFSVPEKMRSQKHSNGKDSNELLNSALLSVQARFNDITKNLISDKINALNIYKTFINNKFS